MSQKVKKAFQPLADLLNANQDAAVSAIMPQALEIMSAKARGAADGQGSTFIKGEDGSPLAILDYYFKKWMPVVGPEAVEFGAKATSATGLSNMSKAGTSLWTKQQRDAKAAMQNLLVDLESGALEVSDLADAKEGIEADRKVVEETDQGFAEKSDVIAYLEANGFTPAATDE